MDDQQPISLDRIRKRWQTCVVCRADFYSLRIDAMTCSPACRKALSRWQKREGRAWKWGDIIRTTKRTPPPKPDGTPPPAA